MIRKRLVSIRLLVLLLLALSLTTSCTLWQNDPAGASLLALKNTYEASVRTAGRLYIAGEINEGQLKNFRDEARKFYLAYNIAISIHEQTKTVSESSMTSLQRAADALEGLILSFTSRKIL